jgi:hypothetical protein
MSFNLQYLDSAKLERLLPYALPVEWKNKAHVNWDDADAELTQEWLAHFWKFMEKKHFDYTTFDAWPLIPTTTGLVRLNKALSVLNLDDKCPTPLRALLKRARCHIFMSTGIEFPTKLLSVPTASGLSNALGAAPGIESHHFTQEEADISYFTRSHIAIART